MARRRREVSFWQSYADLAMGVMAVLALILILLLIQQKDQNANLEKERKDFAEELMKILEKSQSIIERQDDVQHFVQDLFTQEDCQLVLTNDGKLQRKGSDSAAQLYAPGEVALSEEAQKALESCAANFERLANCLVLDKDSRGSCPDPKSWKPKSSPAAVKHQLQEGIEALVLQGNTDNTAYLSNDAPRIVGISASKLRKNPKLKNFVRNAFLGSERARQSMAHLLHLVSNAGEERRDPLEILMSRVRIESPSFGLYQAGPGERKGDCPDEGDCDEARNLSLLLRWKKSALRQPYLKMKEQLCKFLQDKNSAFYRGLLSTGKRPADIYRANCRVPTEPKK